MLRFEGSESFPLAPADVYAKLADAGWLARALPDAEVTEAAADRATWKVRPKFAFMSGVLDTTAEITGRGVDPSAVRYRIASRGVGSSSAVDAELTVRPVDSGCTVQWSGDVTELGGLLKMVPRGLVQAAVQKVIEDVWQSVRGKLAA
ncbi:CoxG family protein [Fimbriiglobus ruber]|uniref:Carbon monoxide dehydrogenase subunit G n=1 Tax=Fimbriiglobus ruber TaxID=1908690 RepID=A0A225DVX0_9BACT|nr:SRPBCC domain-containing protein [Fimbriiglobus ruber]OWK41786.1 hypothetical protein FRUB_03864 [Fimbriiglobus ruber]